MMYSAQTIVHKGENRIAVRFENIPELRARFKKLDGALWSAELRTWHLPDNEQYRARFKPAMLLPSLRPLTTANTAALNSLINTIQLKGYSPNTLRTYKKEFTQFLHYMGERDAQQCEIITIRDYLLHCINILKLSEATIHSRINAIKFYYEQVLKQPQIFIEIPRPKKPLQLPKVLSMQDVKKLFEATSNLKHNTMLKLCYGLGLRVSEIVNLKIQDIDSQRMQVLIARAKGKKDRYINLPESILPQLRAYYIQYRPKHYLFEGSVGGQYSSRSTQQVFKQAMHKAAIGKDLGIHSLRHSYATHLLEAGTDVRYIQELLGHNDIKTTLIYTSVSNRSLQKIKSPLDMINNTNHNERT